MNIYEGTENYIFVSYAHKDSERVLPIIAELDKAGFRVWYDRGIEAGTEWPAYIQDHIAACKRVLVFISQYSVDSVNCRNEINFAATNNKEMLVAYLEDAELKHGLGLQLGAKQSIFRTRHLDDASFVGEMIKAKILQCCKIGAEESDEFTDRVGAASVSYEYSRQAERISDSSDFDSTVQSRLRGPSLISRVGTMGSSVADQDWPRGKYSQNIDISLYSTIRFHCHLLRPETENRIRKAGIRVFNAKDALVFEDTVSIEFKPGNDRFSLGWVIRDRDGFSQIPGAYTALIWIDDSRVMEYPFIIFAGTAGTAVGGTSLNPEVQREIDDLTKNLRYPRIALYQILNWLSFIFFAICFATDPNSYGFLGFAFLDIVILVDIVFWILYFLS